MKKIITLYGILLFLFVIYSYGFIDQNLIYLKPFYTGFAYTHRLYTSLIYLFCIVLFFIFYLLFIKLARRNILSSKDLKLLILIIITSTILSYPAMLSYDVFNYMTTAKVAFFYKENPYIVMPVEFIGEPFLEFTRAANKVALYGPFWIILTGIPFVVGIGNFFGMLIGLKIINILFYLLTVVMIWRLSRNLIAVTLFALNPLIIIETLISGHNDIVMIALGLLSFYLLFKKKIFFSIIILLLSILIKYATIFLLPVFLFTLQDLLRNKKINIEKTLFISGISMFFIFLLAPVREEIYPWYAIWMLSFLVFSYHKKILLYIIIAATCSLMLTYVPYMYVGMYSESVQLLKLATGVSVPVVILLYFIITNKAWSRNYLR